MDTKLVLNIKNTHNTYSFGVEDLSTYSTTPTNATFEITVPGYNKVALSFVPGITNIFTSADLIPWCDPSDAVTTPIPDGIYTIKYSVYPNSTTFIEKSFIRTYITECKYYDVFMAIRTDCECSGHNDSYLRTELRDIKLLIDGSIAAANQCDLELSYDCLKKANNLLSKIKKCNCK